MQETKLSVNLNKVALIRNARGSNMPDLIKVAKDCESFGAQGITVHPRPDQRHIRYNDIAPLKEVVTTEFNIEGYPSEDFIQLVLTNRPHQVTLVPDPPGVLTSNEGWNIAEQGQFLRTIIGDFKSEGIRTSIFVEPDADAISRAKDVGADRVELYTGHYAHHFGTNKVQAIEAYITAAESAIQSEVGLNAGHDLNLDNLQYFKQHIPNLLEVSIGHALICDALYYGLKNVILMYRNLIR